MFWLTVGLQNGVELCTVSGVVRPAGSSDVRTSSAKTLRRTKPWKTRRTLGSEELVAEWEPRTTAKQWLTVILSRVATLVGLYPYPALRDQNGGVAKLL